MFSFYFQDSLPKELLEELKLDHNDYNQRDIVLLLKEHGELSLNDVLVLFYQTKGIVLKRRYATTMLYRLSKKGVIVKGKKKGHYKLHVDNNNP